MRKQNSTKPTVKELRARLARDLASVLNNPECPAVLYNDMVDRILEMSTKVDWDSAEMIEKTLNGYAEKEEKRTGK